MKYIAEIKKQTEETKEIDVPSYWMEGHSYYRLFSRGEAAPYVRCDIIHIWNPLNQLEFHTNQPINLINFEKAVSITKEEYFDKFDKVIDELDRIINEDNPQEDSFYHLHKELLPTHPEKE
jgi:hypothetical protein